ncbi:curlin [Blastochloris sulfoviridis]|uniref:Curlin n=2 Tax=Blastochloris sulfoviridis TaxID=50712 RepID=A0A5M6HZ01_9HYPH|nr:curlin [Blastochloris sulfoviridis]
MGRLMAALLCLLVAGGCAGPVAETLAKPNEGILPPVLNPVTRINAKLRELPPPAQKVAVAVYSYTDQTGQFKPAETVQQLSRAVTQGATSVIIKSLQDAGNGSWFMVVEREKLDNLLKERRIIADMRNLYLGERSVNPKALPPLLFAGVLLEGGIIGFDSNVRTGGIGAKYLGVGGDVQYREDTVTVYLRVVSTKTGEVLLSVVSHKTIVSIAVRGGAFKYVAIDKILDAEAGFSTNEPKQIAVQQAIEKAVYAMIVEGAARNVWSFRDKAFQSQAIQDLDTEQWLVSSTVHPQANQSEGEQPADAADAGGEKAASDVAGTTAPAPAAATAAAPANPPAAAPQPAVSNGARTTPAPTSGAAGRTAKQASTRQPATPAKVAKDGKGRALAITSQSQWETPFTASELRAEAATETSEDAPRVAETVQ